MKKEEMERAAPIIAREGNESEIINKMKEMIEAKDMASTSAYSSESASVIRAASFAIPADKYTYRLLVPVLLLVLPYHVVDKDDNWYRQPRFHSSEILGQKFPI